MNTQEQETPFLVFHRKFVRERSTIDRDMSLGVDLNCFDFIIIILNSIYGLECVDWWRESKPFSKPYYGYQQSDFFWKLANHGFCPNFIHCTRLGSFNCLKPYFFVSWWTTWYSTPRWWRVWTCWSFSKSIYNNNNNKICTPYCGHVYIINTLSKQDQSIRVELGNSFYSSAFNESGQRTKFNHDTHLLHS